MIVMSYGLRRMHARTLAEAVVLALPGGTQRSHSPTTRWQPSYLRMSAFARSLHAGRSGNSLAVWEVRYRYRGWNGDEMSPVDDGLAALEEVRRVHGNLPVVLVGHSMGARAALRIAGDQSVRGVVALAPWVPRGEPVSQLAGRHIVLAWGSRDRVLPRGSTVDYAERARHEHGLRSVELIVVHGDGHKLIRRPVTWDRIVRGSVGSILGGSGDRQRVW
jgi:pimeloyl-ACP methyl ester carboxylesterase